MDKDTSKTERNDYQVMPFTYENRQMRVIDRNGEPWFAAKEVCDILEISNARDAVSSLDEDEKTNIAITDGHSGHRGGAQSLNFINESGVYNLVFRSRKPEAKRFRRWISSEVLPQIRKTGSYGNEGEACAGKIYRLFSACQGMTIQRMNKVIYYFAVSPPLSSIDIAKLLGVSGGTVCLWRKVLTPEMARSAVKALAINAQGIAEGKSALPPMREDRPGFPLELPAKEAQDEQT